MQSFNINEIDAPEQAPENPLLLFSQWLKEAEKTDADDPNAMCLATADEYGRPSARTLLLKGHDEKGFVFYTNRESRKGRALETNPYAAILFYWKTLDRQVHIEGTVSRVGDEDSDDYFSSRPRGSRIGAWASQQSRSLENRGALKKRIEELEKKYQGNENIPRPPYWGGYLLKPERIEFWQEGTFRLHTRILYTRSGDGWKKEMLFP